MVRFKLKSHGFIKKKLLDHLFQTYYAQNSEDLFVSLGNAMTVALRSIGPMRFKHLFYNKLLIPSVRK